LGFFRTKRDYYCVEQIALSVCVRLKIYWSSGYLKSCTTKEETSPTR
jgi:hypothetical protein